MHPRASLVTKIWCNMPLNMLRFKLFSTFLKAYSKRFLADYTVTFFFVCICREYIVQTPI